MIFIVNYIDSDACQRKEFMSLQAQQKNTAKESGNTSLLKNISLFSKLSDETIEEFLKSAQVIEYKKGHMLYLEDEAAKSFYIIKYGWVKLFHTTLDGFEAVVDILTTGHVFGKNAIFEQDTYSCTAQAVEDTKLVVIPISVLKEQIQKNSQMAISMLSAMSRKTKKREMDVEHLSIQSAPQRIGCFLLRLCPLGKQRDITLHLPYDKVLIASRLGMKPETFSRALNTLKESTGIKINGARIDIDNINKLTGYCCGACSSHYPCEDTKY